MLPQLWKDKGLDFQTIRERFCDFVFNFVQAFLIYFWLFDWRQHDL